jgi:hypothetical protein
MIRVLGVGIDRFRGIRKGMVKDFADVNVLVGRNNSGKSTVLEAIHRVAYLCTTSPGDPLQRRFQAWVNTRAEPSDFASELWYRMDQTEPIKLRAEVGAPKGNIEHIEWTLAKEGTALQQTPSWSRRTPAAEEIAQFLRQATVFRPEDARNPGIEHTLWKKIIGPRLDKQLTKAINTVFNQNAESYNLLEGKVWLLFPKYSVPLDSQGEGNRAALRCLMMLIVLRKTFFIAEEVECHQHPGSLTAFAEAVCQVTRDQEVQLFLSTHSGDCVRAFLAGARKAGTEAVVFHMKLDDGVLDATRLLPEAAQSLLDTGVDVRFLDLYG